MHGMHKPYHITVPLQLLQWLPMVIQIKPKLFILAPKAPLWSQHLLLLEIILYLGYVCCLFLLHWNQRFTSPGTLSWSLMWHQNQSVMPRTQHLFSNPPESLSLSLASVSPTKSLQTLRSEQHLLEMLLKTPKVPPCEGIYAPSPVASKSDLICGMRQARERGQLFRRSFYIISEIISFFWMILWQKLALFIRASSVAQSFSLLAFLVGFPLWTWRDSSTALQNHDLGSQHFM